MGRSGAYSASLPAKIGRKGRLVGSPDEPGEEVWVMSHR